MKLKTTSILTLVITLSLLVAQFPLIESAKAQSNARPLAVDSKKETHKNLSKFATNLTALAQQGLLSPAPAWKAAVERTIRILSKSNDNNPLLLDEMGGVNSTIVVENVAKRIATGEVPASLRTKQLWKLDLGSLLAGAADSNDAVSRLNTILSEVASSDGQDILFIDQITSVAGVYGQEVENALRIALASNLRFMSASTTNEAANTEKENLLAYFRSVKVDENTDEVTELGDAEYEFVGDKVSPDLRELMRSQNSKKRVKVILQADDINSAELRTLLSRNGARINESMERLGVLEVELPINTLEQIASNDKAKHLSLDRNMSFLGHVEVTTGADAMRMQSGNSELDGTGIAVAVLDSGLFRDHDSMDQVKFEMDFTGEGTNLDYFGHGTHVTGLLANKENFDGNYLGVAPKVDIVNLRVLNKQGTGTVTSVLKALNWILEPSNLSNPASEKNYQKYKIKVVNLSLGAPAIESYKNDPLCRAVRRLVDIGIVVVAASGNNGKDSNGQKQYGLIHSPGNEPSAITVGASNTYGTDARDDDGIASFSSRGPTRSYWTDENGVKHYDNLIKPELVAPGNKLIAAEAAVKARVEGSDKILPNVLIEQHPELRAVDSTDYRKRMMRMSGTSMATPIVAGAAALMLQANPNLTPNMVKMILMYTAQPLAGYNTLEQGAGQLNIEGAIGVAKRVRTDLNWTTTTQGTSLLGSGPLPTANTTIAGQNFTWAQGILLNRNYATGINLITQYQKVYGLGFVKGDGFVIGDGFVVGDGFVLGDGIIMGDNIMTSDGIIMGDGTVFLDGTMLRGDGIVMSDGFVIGDGIVLSDGFVIGDGIVMSDAAVQAMSALVGGDNTPAMK